MTSDELPIDEFIVHRPPMRLLDRIVSVSESDAVAETVVRSDNPFFEPGRGLPGYVGLEMMAQTIALIDGHKRRSCGLPVNMGFLLGCRRYVSKHASFSENEKLTVTASKVFGDGAMFAFDCRLDDERGEVATANLKVYAPADPHAFLKGGVR
ncbi:MAG: 3-hydroxyacyl-ACP dehydratase [Rhizomicrobium sp.]|jgi:predicted hotdog family 3-hydroxylacyl-ACP dehydratase